MASPSVYTHSFIDLILGFTTPQQQIGFLLERKNYYSWEAFRDSLVRRWTNLNVVCGLIMGAISTILFADFQIGRAAFALGAVSLLSSLIAIGFGVGLIYVLGDVKGARLHMIGRVHPKLYLFALSIPQTWAAVSFCAFFACTCTIIWEAMGKGIIVRLGVIASVVILFFHVIGFGYLFNHDDPEYLIPAPTTGSHAGDFSGSFQSGNPNPTPSMTPKT